MESFDIGGGITEAGSFEVITERSQAERSKAQRSAAKPSIAEQSIAQQTLIKGGESEQSHFNKALALEWCHSNYVRCVQGTGRDTTRKKNVLRQRRQDFDFAKLQYPRLPE